MDWPIIHLLSWSSCKKNCGAGKAVKEVLGETERWIYFITIHFLFQHIDCEGYLTSHESFCVPHPYETISASESGESQGSASIYYWGFGLRMVCADVGDEICENPAINYPGRVPGASSIPLQVRTPNNSRSIWKGRATSPMTRGIFAILSLPTKSTKGAPRKQTRNWSWTTYTHWSFSLVPSVIASWDSSKMSSPKMLCWKRSRIQVAGLRRLSVLQPY